MISLWTSVWNTGCATSSVMNFSSIDILFAFIIILGYHTKLSHLYPTKITICLNFLSLLLLHFCLLPHFCLLLLLFPHLLILLVGEHDQPHNLPVENTVSLVDQIGDIDQSIFLFVASLAGHLGYFYTKQNQIGILILGKIFVPSSNILKINLEFFMLINFLFNRPVQSPLLSFK